MKEENSCVSPQEKYFLNTFPLIRRIANRNLSISNPDAAEDIFQTVTLRLWNWKTKEERNLSEEEWCRYANRATRNEIKRFYGSKFRKEVQMPEIEDYETVSIVEGFYLLAGNTESEALSFLKYLWKTIQELSIRQKYALLFQKQDLLFELVARKCCTIEEIAGSLALSREEFITLAGGSPLPNEAIQEILEIKTGDKITVKQVWMARGKAKAKLNAALKGLK